MPWNRLVLSLVNFAFVSSKALTKKKISMLLYNNRLHGRSVTSDVSKNKPINFVSCGPIGTQSVPFALVRPQQWISRVFFIKKTRVDRISRLIVTIEMKRETCLKRPKGNPTIATVDPDGQPSSATLIKQPVRIASRLIPNGRCHEVADERERGGRPQRA